MARFVYSITFDRGLCTQVSLKDLELVDLPAIGTDKLLGSSGATVAPIAVGSGLSLSGGVLSAIGGGGGGTVTSVGLAMPEEFSVAGSPVTGAGAFAVSKATQYANTVYAGPVGVGTGTGALGVPSFRLLSGWDIPTQMSLASDIAGVKLDGDSDAPGSNFYYGTDATGSKGFYELPVDSKSGVWRYDATSITMGNPGTGAFRTDNATWSSTTQIALAAVNSSGVDVTNVLKALEAGDVMQIQDKANSANWIRFDIAAVPTDNASWFLVPVAMHSGAGVRPNHNSLCLISVTVAGGGGGTGVSDGNKGDITVSGSGATWTINSGAVTASELAPIASGNLLGRSTAGSGAVELIAVVASLSLTGLSLKLVGDLATPGNSYYYGTDPLGNKGWLPYVDARSGVWAYDSTVTMADPGSGEFRINATTLAAASFLAISTTNQNGIDTADLLKTLRQGDIVQVQDRTTSSNWARYTITAAPTNNATWFFLQMSAVSGGGVAMAPGTLCTVSFSPANVATAVVLAGTCQGRLTLTSGTPVTTADATGSTIYFTPYLGDRVALYSGSAWTSYTFTQRSLSLSGVALDTNYDVFLYDSGGNPTLELSSAWYSSTQRFASGPYATLLPLQDSIPVKSTDGTAVDATRRYLGTIRGSASGTVTDTTRKRFVWNCYNRVLKHLFCRETSGSWSQSVLDTWRVTNANPTDNKAEIVRGQDIDVVEAVTTQIGRSTISSPNLGAGIGVDSQTVNSALIFGAPSSTNFFGYPAGHYKGCPGAGYRIFYRLELASGSTISWVDNLASVCGGMYVTGWF